MIFKFLVTHKFKHYKNQGITVFPYNFSKKKPFVGMTLQKTIIRFYGS